MLRCYFVPGVTKRPTVLINLTRRTANFFQWRLPWSFHIQFWILFKGQLQQEDCAVQLWQSEKCQHSCHHQCFNVCHWHPKDWGGGPCVYPQVWTGSWMVNRFPWYALTGLEGTITGSNTWTWKRRDRRMHCLWKTFTSFGFLSLFLTTQRTTKQQRCQSIRDPILITKNHPKGHWGHGVDPDQGGRLYCKSGWQCWRNQHLWRPLQQDHLWASLHQNIQVHLSTPTLPLWHPGLKK